MPVFAWVLLATNVAGVLLIWYLFEALNGRITMNLNDLLASLQDRAQKETDLKTSIVAALASEHQIISQLRDEMASGGLSSDQSTKFQAVLDALDQNRSAIADAIVANTDTPEPTPAPAPAPTPAPEPTPVPAPEPTPAGDDTISGPAGDDTVSGATGDDTTSSTGG